MICPLKFTWIRPFSKNPEEKNRWLSCEKEYCQAWDTNAKYNPENKDHEGDCRLFMLDRKISGGISTHSY